jgi:multiple sugar transport system permease protein
MREFGEQYRKIGGWLILPAIGLVLSPPLLLLDIVWILSNWEAGPVFVLALIKSIVFLVFTTIVSLYFFRKLAIAPTLFIALMLSSLAFAIIEFFVAYFFLSTVFAFIGCLMWIPYFLTSNRVKRTFVRSGSIKWVDQLFGLHIPLVPFILFSLFPFYFMVITSFKTDGELYDLKAVPFWIFREWTIEHYHFLLRDTPFLTWLFNSVLVSVLATGLSIVIAILAAYSLARLRFRGAPSFGTAVFITYLVPTTLLFLPLAQVVNRLGLADSVWSLILTYPTFLVPFCTWLLLGYFRTIPQEIEECAMVDGCTRFQALIRIVLPVAIPGIVCAVLFAFTISWNEFIYALTFISSTAQKTTTVGVTAELIRGDIFYWGSLMAGAVLGSIPIVLVYVVFMDYYVSGLTQGAIK